MFPQIKIFNSQIPTFFLVISLSLTLLLFWLSARLDSENGKKFNRPIAYNLSLLIMVCGFWGARVFHVFYEEFSFYQEYPAQILKFWNGGFVYFGGMTTAFLASFIYLKSKKQDLIKWADFMTPLLSASYALGRVGCFFEGCCYGKTCDLPWAVAGLHPTQLYMAMGEFFILGLILLFEKKKSVYDGFLFFIWILLHSVFRFVFEFFRDDDRGNAILGLSISQAICLILISMSFGFIIRTKIKN